MADNVNDNNGGPKSATPKIQKHMAKVTPAKDSDGDNKENESFNGSFPPSSDSGTKHLAGQVCLYHDITLRSQEYVSQLHDRIREYYAGTIKWLTKELDKYRAYKLERDGQSNDLCNFEVNIRGFLLDIRATQPEISEFNRRNNAALQQLGKQLVDANASLIGVRELLAAAEKNTSMLSWKRRKPQKISTKGYSSLRMPRKSCP
jgi:hypothetical protein